MVGLVVDPPDGLVSGLALVWRDADGGQGLAGRAARRAEPARGAAPARSAVG